jgi:hypothetical protein
LVARHLEAGKFPTLTIRRTAFAVAPLARVIVRTGEAFRAAGLPIRRPVRETPETPGYPRKEHARAARFVNWRW